MRRGEDKAKILQAYHEARNRFTIDSFDSGLYASLQASQRILSALELKKVLMLRVVKCVEYLVLLVRIQLTVKI